MYCFRRIPEAGHMWYLPKVKDAFAPSHGEKNYESGRQVAVVLIGWLGSHHRHLQKYAEWYASRGFHAVALPIPIGQYLGFIGGGVALENNIKHLSRCLKEWLTAGGNNRTGEKYIIFHAFCVGWVMRGYILEDFSNPNHKRLVDRIVGCIIDSGPILKADDLQFNARACLSLLFRKYGNKRSTWTVESSRGDASTKINRPTPVGSVVEETLKRSLSVIYRLFDVARKLNSATERAKEQHHAVQCPELYLYSSGDRVVPKEWVESFIAERVKRGGNVSSCDFKWTPHLGHFVRSYDLYAAQLTGFLDRCLAVFPRNQSQNVQPLESG